MCAYRPPRSPAKRRAQALPPRDPKTRSTSAEVQFCSAQRLATRRLTAVLKCAASDDPLCSRLLESQFGCMILFLLRWKLAATEALGPQAAPRSLSSEGLPRRRPTADRGIQTSLGPAAEGLWSSMQQYRVDTGSVMHTDEGQSIRLMCCSPFYAKAADGNAQSLLTSMF